MPELPVFAGRLRAMPVQDRQVTEEVTCTTTQRDNISPCAVTMFEPVRGGTRGGQAEFKWADVSADKDREVCFSGPCFNYYVEPFSRIISATVSMLLPADGKRTRIFTGTIET